MKKLILVLTILCFPVVIFAGYEDIWDGLLKKYTTTGVKNGITLTLVDYNNLRNDKNWKRLIQTLKTAESLQSLIGKESPKNTRKLAFWINVYNIGAVKMMTDNYKLESIKDKSGLFNSVWDQEIIDVAGTKYSLGHIEHKILRKMGEPLIHAAIVCASVSCPDLRREAFQPEKLDNQLKSQMTGFLKNSQKGFRIDKKEQEIYASSIFKWFDDDFGDLRNFFVRYLPDSKKEILNKLYNIEYLDYDWDSNELE